MNPEIKGEKVYACKATHSMYRATQVDTNGYNPHT